MITRECDVETSADFSRYYASSYVGWHGRETAGIVSPAFVGRTTNDTIALKFFSNKDGTFTTSDWEYFSLDQLKQHVDFGRPKLGMQNNGPTVVFLSQTSPREPRKGLRIREARQFDFNAWDTRHILPKTTNPYDERIEWVWSAFNRQKISFKDEFLKLQKGDRIGTAISADIGIFTQQNSLYPLLAYKRWTVGHVRNEELILLHSIYADYEPEIRKVTGVEVRVS